ncbi:MAG TPA: hemolysin III family protein [Bacillota bacterium]|nr:hemolysin III family protein [Bacillota bacterium]HOH10423.1 hemolysin III family protein [Bacillota bacterium]HPI01039.1 hemolysin III family protein [Bacillota bacterium]HPM63136.1 hemolysin III family protein [Bacillota bacterium]
MARQWVMSTEEEVANSITHGIMAALALLALPYLAIRGYLENGNMGAVTKSIFMISMFLMFLTSCLYHAMAFDSKHKLVFRILDHICIYVAIAGSYTPIALLTIGGAVGWAVVCLQWGLVIFGALNKSLSVKSVLGVSLAFYLIMGWTAVILLPVLLRKGSVELIAAILAGGLFYSIGAIFYALKGFKYHHMVWHLLINLGAVSHFIAIMMFV